MIRLLTTPRYSLADIAAAVTAVYAVAALVRLVAG